MVEEIYNVKNKILAQVKKELEERGPERIDVNRMGAMVDMVKDLAEAEESCWEAEYYKSVTQAMNQGQSGYGSGGGTGSSAGYGSSIGGRSGYGSQSNMGYVDGRSGYGSMGHQEVMEPLRAAIQKAGPDERDRLRNEIKTIIGMM